MRLQCDDRKLGCSLNITYNRACAGADALQTSLRWLTQTSGLSKEYIDKILVARLTADSKCLVLEFDDSANCCEAAQQITCLEFDNKTPSNTNNDYVGHGRYAIENVPAANKIKVVSVICPCGQFVEVIRRYASLQPGASDLRKFGDEMAEHGQVVALDRCKMEGVCTGDLRAVVFVHRADSKLLRKDLFSNETQPELYKIKPFLPTADVRISADIVQEMWSQYGAGRRNGDKAKQEEINELDAVEIDQGNDIAMID